MWAAGEDGAAAAGGGDRSRCRREPICGSVVPLGEELELLWRYHRRRPVCGSGDDGDGFVGAAAADGGELVRCVQRPVMATGRSAGEENQNQGGCFGGKR